MGRRPRSTRVGHTDFEERTTRHRPISLRRRLFRNVVPEEGIEPSRGVTPTGF
jgi:hypothetical protein